MDSPLKKFVEDVSDLGPAPDAIALSSLVGGFTLDLDYWSHHIDRIGEQSSWMHASDRGIQVAVARRTDGTMSYVHSHNVSVALSAIVGVETHRHYHVQQGDDDHVTATLLEERHLRGGTGEVVTLVPPHDVHSHGHVRGTGDWPYTLIVLGDNQFRFERKEFDLSVGRSRVLPPGDRGTPNLPAPVG